MGCSKPNRAAADNAHTVVSKSHTNVPKPRSRFRLRKKRLMHACGGGAMAVTTQVGRPSRGSRTFSRLSFRQNPMSWLIARRAALVSSALANPLLR